MCDLNAYTYKFNRKKLQIVLIAICVMLLVIGIYRYSLLVAIAGNIIDSYLTFIERILNWLLSLFHSKYSILGHKVYHGTELITTINSNFLLLKRTLILMVVGWITPTRAVFKLKFTGLVILCNMVGALVYIGLVVHFITYFTDADSINYIGRLPFESLLLFIFLNLIWHNRENIFRSGFAQKYNLEFLENNLRKISIAIVVYVLFSSILLGLFKYSIWINYLFSTSAWILNHLDYPAWVESHILIGENHSIHMTRPCLGFNTMLLFALLIFITGKNNRTMWIFIFVGLVILNLSNITRFILLFIHLQNHGQYVFSIDLHDLYNYFIYGIVFLLWIIWFEKYSYIKREKKKVN